MNERSWMRIIFGLIWRVATIALILALFFLALELTESVLSGKSRPTLPAPNSLDGIQTYGCNINQISGQAVMPAWKTEVWAQFSEHRWTGLLSIHPSDEKNARFKAFKACDNWMTYIHKEAQGGNRPTLR